MNAATAQCHPAAPALQVAAWLNAPGPLSLAALRGKVVAVYAFQMLCPACVAHGIPQAKRIAATFARADVAVLGLHTVFEHHRAMGPEALAAFLHEYRVDFPVAIDLAADSGPVPRTMASYGMRGTPTLLLVDRHGVLRHQLFGSIDDMQVGALVARLAAEPVREAMQAAQQGALKEGPGGARCDDDACRLPA